MFCATAMFPSPFVLTRGESVGWLRFLHLPSSQHLLHVRFGSGSLEDSERRRAHPRGALTIPWVVTRRAHRAALVQRPRFVPRETVLSTECQGFLEGPLGLLPPLAGGGQHTPLHQERHGSAVPVAVGLEQGAAAFQL